VSQLAVTLPSQAGDEWAVLAALSAELAKIPESRTLKRLDRVALVFGQVFTGVVRFAARCLPTRDPEGIIRDAGTFRAILINRASVTLIRPGIADATRNSLPPSRMQVTALGRERTVDLRHVPADGFTRFVGQVHVTASPFRSLASARDRKMHPTMRVI
jgi:hypothetical protein